MPRPTSAETNLHAEGAEFLVLGHLLIRGVHATKAYTRYPGWDVLAMDAETGRACRVQVKARLRTDYGGAFPIKNFDAEFVVHEPRLPSPGSDDGGERAVEFFVLPMPEVRRACEGAGMWGESYKVFLGRIPNVDRFRDAWNLIVDYLRPVAPEIDGRPRVPLPPHPGGNHG